MIPDVQRQRGDVSTAKQARMWRIVFPVVIGFTLAMLPAPPGLAPFAL
jgi:hypothetical protein